MFVVYKHTCHVNGKFYVGFTPNKETDCRDPHILVNKRWNAHVRSARKGSKFRFHAAIRKHGEQNFEHEVLEIVSSREEAVVLEKRWIADLDAMNLGYNMTSGGDGVLDLTPEDREKQRLATKAAMSRPEVKAKMLAAAKMNRQKKSESVRRSWTDPEMRRRHLEGMNSEAYARRGFRVEQIEPHSMLVIATFASIHQASRVLGIPRSTLQAHLSGRLRFAGGFLWKRTS